MQVARKSVVFLGLALVHSVVGRFHWDQTPSPPPCPPHPTPPASFDQLSKLPLVQEALSNITTIIAKSVNVGAPGAMSALIFKDQIVWSQSFGMADVQTGAKPTLDSIFRIGSITKVFTALMAFQQDERHAISLDDEVSDYAPYRVKNPFSKESTTFRQLASQNSGLPRSAPCNLAGLEGTIVCNVTTADMLERMANETSLIVRPWTRPSYSNLGFAVLGNVLATYVVKDQTYAQYIDTEILQPLGMDNSGVLITPAIRSKMAVGYDSQGTPIYPTDIGFERPAGNMYSTAADLSKVVGAFLQAYEGIDSKILPSDRLTEMALPVFFNWDGLSAFASPFEVLRLDDYIVRLKGGNVPGFSSVISFASELGLGFVTVWNGAVNEDGIAEPVWDALISALVPSFDKVDKIPLPPNPAVYTGTYLVDGHKEAGEFTIGVDSEGYLALTQREGSSVFKRYLKYMSEDEMVMYDPVGIPQASCFMIEIEATEGSRVLWTLGPDGRATKFTMPGYAYGLTFIRSD